MTDAINDGMASDRLMLAWRMDETADASACAGRPRQPVLRPAPPEPALTVGPDLAPVGRDTGAPAVTVAVPPEVEALAPDRRRAWRAAVREALGGRLAAGAAVTGFLRRPDRYLVEQAEGSRA